MPWKPAFYMHKNTHSSFLSLSSLKHWGLCKGGIQVQHFLNSWRWQCSHHRIILSRKRMPQKFLSLYKLEEEVVLLQLPKVVPGSIQNPGWLKTPLCRFLQPVVEKWLGERQVLHNVSWTLFRLHCWATTSTEQVILTSLHM